MMKKLLWLLVFFWLNPVLAEVPTSREQVHFSFAPVVKKTVPAVVNIYTSHIEKVQASPFMNDPLFNQMLGMNAFGTMPRERLVNSLGSGVIVGKDGTVVTNYHVIKGSDAIKVILSDKREFKAHIVKTDEHSDLALLKLDTEGITLPALELRDSESLEVGDLVLAIGNPFGVGQTVTSGIISALSRSNANVSDYEFFIQTDAAINPGNSGGALVDMEGKLIGINTAIYSRTGGYQGIGFAIPATMVSAFLKSHATREGNVIHPWFGVAVQTVNAEIAAASGLPAPKGVLIQAVAKDSPAERAGIRAGDILLSVNGGEVNDSPSLNVHIATSGIGENVPLVIWRNGKEIAINAQFSAAPSAEHNAGRVRLKGNHPMNGVVVSTLTPELAGQYGLSLDKPCVVILESRGNFQKGDIIISLNDQEISTVGELQQVLANSNHHFVMTLNRGGMQVVIAIQN